MPSFAIGLFCEDVRDEKTGTQTIVGVLPDNVALPAVPASLPKLALYLRFMLDPASDPDSISASLIFPGGEVREVVTMPPDSAKAACKAARDSGWPYAGLIAVVNIQQFTISATCRLVAMAKIDGQEQVCAALNFQVQSTSSIAPGPPA